VNGFTAHQIFIEIALGVTHTYITHFAMKVAGVIHTKHQPFWRHENPMWILGGVNPSQCIGNSLYHEID